MTILSAIKTGFERVAQEIAAVRQSVPNIDPNAINADTVDGLHASHFMPQGGGVFGGNISFDDQHNTLHKTTHTNGSLEFSGGTGSLPTGAHIALRGSTSTHNVHGLELYAGGQERVRLDHTGALQIYNQPACVVSRNTNTEFWGPGTHVGLLGGFITHRGGFFAGPPNFNGAPGAALHVPKTGYYLFMLDAYFRGDAPRANRLFVIRNSNGGDICAFAHTHLFQVSGDRKHTATNIRFLNQGDHLSYFVPPGHEVSAFHDANHTKLAIAFLG